MTDHILDELTWRGLISQTTGEDELREALDAGPITLYCGFDPTAPSLHIGNLVQILTVRRFQLAGHKPLMLVGGATGLIGDPKMAGERTLNPVEIVHQWVERIRGQIEPFMSFTGENAARMVNNYEWTKDMSAIELLRDVGKYFRLGTMISKDTVARRLNSDEGISYTEFSYQVLQGMDFLELYRRYGCTLQTGGSDQWGNLTSGTELTRKAEGTSVHALSTPLITKADGTKFGKTESGTVWLDPEMTSPYAFYQFWLNQADADVIGYLKVFTFLERAEIEALEVKVAEEPFRREAQRTLAWEVTRLVHGEAAAQGAVDASQALFGRGELGALDGATLDGCAKELGGVDLDPGATVVDALVSAGIVDSRKAARRAIEDGGAYVNNVRVDDPDLALGAGHVLAGGWVVVRRGKKSVGIVRPVA
ncbi:tyrosine--tRNA ligase [Demequina sp. SYSU T00039]|uniref:Tyrosine--tRNA ligase n=1 Tax=Demequina lignilytica TaxID=3051663 RepID=A0AAW7M3Z1_9MICO|nr:MULTISPECIES: tyrosine--tRNA ligase [unclassified Demequina]MDN4477014.1 tyrosine--tRNA ligase [Demequina sp. SYSU T00039-1]MDN4487187.1 tyrosine--tRNA ligase [Demequina sp. SYSU T00039]